MTGGSAGGGAGGMVGTRGPGETQLEVDRRKIREKLTRLKARLHEVERTRSIQRQRRLEVPYPTVALVGYTNSGKSTLMNALTEAEVEAADRPFSTLDPTIRRLRLANKMNVMLVDTVGFIHRLPHMLIEAFKATLEEVRTASLLLHVVDASSPLASDRMKIVDGVLEEIGAGAAPRIMVMNKIDLMHDGMRPHVEHDSVAISARTGDGLDELLAAVARFFATSREEISVTLEASRGDLVAMARRDGEVLSEEYEDGRVAMRALVSARGGRPIAQGRAYVGKIPQNSIMATPMNVQSQKQGDRCAHFCAGAAAGSAQPSQFADAAAAVFDSAISRTARLSALSRRAMGVRLRRADRQSRWHRRAMVRRQDRTRLVP